MELRQCILTKNDCYKAGRKITPKGIVVHSTGANNPNLKRYVQPDDGNLGVNTNNNDWNRSGLNVCVHAFIGKNKAGKVCTYQTLPWNYRCWGCASGKNGSYNNSHIQFEVCQSSNTDAAYYKEAIKEAKELCAYLCKKYNLPVSSIASHAEAHKKGYASNHGDIDSYMKPFGDSMDKFRADVQKLINGQKEGDSMSEPEIKKLPIIVDGKQYTIDGVFCGGLNFVSVRQLASLLGCTVSSKGSTPVLTKK